MSYVVVTIAPSGVVHVYGGPFPTRAKALPLQRELKRNDEEMYPNQPPVRVAVCKILADPEK